jgi:hypothetical protein
MDYLDSYSKDFGDIHELQLQNMWVLTFPDAGKDFDLYVKSVSFPNFGLSFGKTKFDLVLPEGKADYGDVEITFMDSVTFVYINFFTNWIHSLYDFSNHTYSKFFHTKKKMANLKLLTPLNMGVTQDTKGYDPAFPVWNPEGKYKWVINKEYQLSGLQIQGISDYDLNESGEPIEFSVTMSVQNIRMIEGNRKSLQYIPSPSVPNFSEGVG